jgi:molybdopterin-guanine dinucleotide biosynthesis protein B
MRVFGLSAWSGSGKTTLLVRLIPALTARGLAVSTIKRAHHDFDLDQPGKDSWRHREAGATEVMISSGRRWALQHELRGEAEPEMAALLAHLTPVDLVLIEGFKRYPHPKLEIIRPSIGKEPIFPTDPWVRAVAAVEQLPPEIARRCALPVFEADDIARIADFVIATAEPPDGRT